MGHCVGNPEATNAAADERTYDTDPRRAGTTLQVAAVILNWNQASLTLECVACVRPQVDRVYVVDNNSAASDKVLLTQLPDDITVIANRQNLGYAGGCNVGISAALDAGCSSILVMNNDAFPDPGGIALLVAHLSATPGVAAVGPAVVQRRTRQVLHVACSLSLRTGRAAWLRSDLPADALGTTPVPTAYLSGEAMLIRSDVIRHIGMFEPRFFCYYEDVDWSIRAQRAGWRLEVVPDAVFEHVVSASSTGHGGIYFRARNLPLMLRITCGRSRLAAFVLSARTELLWFLSLLRDGEFVTAFRDLLGGWAAGVAQNV